MGNYRNISACQDNYHINMYYYSDYNMYAI